ncbi:MAG: iron ABC transporter permease [Treponema sp.]|nr:iron ABC transporter permease [Treponema sp.]
MFTLKIALGSTFVAFAIGFPFSFYCAKRRFLFKKIIQGFSAVPLCIPVLIAALGFVSVFGISGSFNKVYSFLSGGDNTKFLYSEWGIMISQGFYNFPLIMTMISKYWESLPCETEEAARVLGSCESQIFLKITLPKLSPVIVSSVIPVFLFCYFSFMMVLLFSAPGTVTLEVEIFQAVKTSLDYVYASKLAICETLVAFLCGGVYIFFYDKNLNSGNSFEKKDLPWISSYEYQSKLSKIIELLLFVIISVLVIIFFILPFAGIIISGFTARINGKDVFSFNHYKILFSSKSFWKAVEITLITSFCTAFVCTLIGTVYALSLQNLKNDKIKKLFEIVSLLPMNVSSVVLGFGITLIFKKGNIILLILLQSALFWPLSYRQINTAIKKVPKNVYEAGLIISNNYRDFVFRVLLPWIRKSLFSSFGFCFAFSAGDTTLPLLLSLKNFQTLSLYTYRLSGSYRFNTACASGTILGLICFLVFIFSEKIGNNRFKD